MEPTNRKEFFTQFLESVQTGMIVIDRDKRVVAVNSHALQMVEKDGAVEAAMLCCELLSKEMKFCPDCMFETQTGVCPQPKSLAIKRANGADILVKVKFARLGEYCVLTLTDVTKEVNLLKKVDLTRKELQAKNIILERRQEEARKEFQHLEDLFNLLPEAVMTVDENYTVITRNAAITAILGTDKGERCYEYLGNDFPCDGCPAEHGFDPAGDMKKSHTIRGRFITEILSASRHGGMLLFRDSTRQIGLIEQIREQRDSIDRRNKILNGLVNFSERMQKEAQTVAVIDFFIDIFLPVVKSNAAALILDDVRPGSLWLTKKREITDDELKDIARAYLARDMQSTTTGHLPPEVLPWPEATQVPLVGGNGRRVGMLILQGIYKAQEDDFDLIQLFTEPLGAYIHNRLLLRQLEERANTDSLTGLYNRSYFDQAIKEEIDKFTQYGIHFSVVVVDVNRLKMANDVYGHEAGDKLIMMVSKLLADTVRSTDIVARTGGDEYNLLLTNSLEESANLFIKRMKDKVFNEVYMEVGDGEQFPVTVSLGAAGTDKVAIEELIKEADRKMYVDKEEYYKSHKKYR